MPRMACQKSISITYSRSPPFSGFGLLRAAPAEELGEDIAETAAAGFGAPARAAAARARSGLPDM